MQMLRDSKVRSTHELVPIFFRDLNFYFCYFSFYCSTQSLCNSQVPFLNLDGFIAIALIDGEAHSTIEHFQNVQNVVFSISLWRQGETLVIIDGGEYVFHCFYSETHSLSSF